MKYAFIGEHATLFPVAAMCSVLGVSRSGFYSWKHRNPPRSRMRLALVRAIEKVFLGSKGAYGSPRIYRHLKALGYRVSKRRVEFLMREYGLRARKRRAFRTTTNSKHNYPVSPNLVDRKFDRGRRNSVWLSDITYLETEKGWVYLAAVMDAHTRKIVGWSLADHLRSELATTALQSALNREDHPLDVIVHSDRGVQYASRDYRRIMLSHNLRQSMSRQGNCWDNAPMESFFDTLKTEHVHHQQYRDLSDARGHLFYWIEVFYNRQRLHSSLGYKSPCCFERDSVAKAA